MYETTDIDQIVDDLSDAKGGEQSSGSDFIETDDDGSTNKTQRKDQSNFKTLYKKYKTLEEENKALREKYSSENNGVNEENDFSEERLGRYDKADILSFAMDNEDARPYKNDIVNTLNKFPGMTIEEAFVYVKALNKPSADKPSDDFDFVSEVQTRPKKLSEIRNEDEIYKMLKEGKISNEQFIKWNKANGLF